MKNKIRIEYLDSLKCFSIFLVVWGHAAQYLGSEVYINNILYSQIILAFHMPLFAVISGMFFYEGQDFVQFIIRKIQLLLLPMFVWGIILYCILLPIKTMPINSQYVFLHYFRSVIINMLFGGWWFLRAIFLCHLYAYLFTKFNIIKMAFSLFVSIIILYAIAWLGIIPNNNTFFNGFIFLYPFFCIGKIFSYYKWGEINNIKALLLLFALLVISLMFWKGYPDSFYEMNTSLFVKTGYMGIYGGKVIVRTFVRLLSGFAGSLFFIYLFRFISSKKINFRGLGLIRDIGKETLGIYIIHTIVFEFVFWKPQYNNPILFVLAELFVSIIIIIASYYFCKIIEKNTILALLFLGKKHQDKNLYTLLLAF